MKQHTIASHCVFQGKGLHTGRPVRMELLPAPAGSGLCFCRLDRDGAVVHASARNVSKVDRSTSLKEGRVSVRTVEHLLAALYALGVDNARICLDAEELPILDGSARPYAEAVLAAGLVEQDQEREYIVVKERFEYAQSAGGSVITVEPCEDTTFSATIDFGSKVIGVQTAQWDGRSDFSTEIAPCRTFCFLSDIKPLMALGLIKGGDLGNALVIDEPSGYFGNPVLRFENECARHKLLDLIGDFSLLGRPLKGKVTAYKPGHRINTAAALALLDKIE